MIRAGTDREGREETNMGVEMMEATKLSEITGRIFVEVVVVVMVVMVGHTWMMIHSGGG